MEISYERWQQAQEAEFKEYWDHRVSIAFGGFENVFNYLGVDPKNDLKDKVIVEVASGSVPALMMVEGAKRRVAIEPLMDKWQKQKETCEAAGVEVVAAPYEHIDIEEEVDETWLFNCLQHVISPEGQLKKAMETSKVVRVFEPIGWGNGHPLTANTAHPHIITKETFTSVMGDFGKTYNGREVAHFHEADCYYGTWVKG